jgi:transcriptional regulator with XRE-family HTH domain
VPLSPDQQRLLTALGARIRSERVARKHTQEWLAEQVGINPRTVQKIEAGKLNILVTTLARIQAALKSDWDDLMGSRRRRG